MIKKRLGCLVLAVLMMLTVCAGAAMAFSQEDVVPLYCHHGGGRGHHGGGHHGTASGTADGSEYPWLFCPSKGCVDMNCTDETHYHYCPALCDDPDHEHYCDLEDVEFICGETWHRSGCCHTGVTNYSYSCGCTDDYHNCTRRGHYHHCPADCTNPLHRHFDIVRNDDGSVEMVPKTA